MLYNQNEHVIPPGNQRFPQTGVIRLTIDKLSYLKQSNINLSYRICIWGSKNPQLFLPENNKLTAKYSIKCSYEILMKYLIDMEMLVIESFDSRNSKLIGNIYINLKRFQTINKGMKIIQNFMQSFDIFNLKKQKVGEVQLNFTITQLKRNEVKNMEDVEKIIQSNNQNNKNLQNLIHKNRFNDSNKGQNRQDEFIRKISHKNENNKIEQEQQQNTQLKNQMEERELNKKTSKSPSPPPIRKKNKQLQTEQQSIINRNKELDLNYSVNLELMKLKDDEAQLIYKPQQNLNGSQFNLILSIMNVKLLTRAKQQQDKFTLIYPQTNYDNKIVYITSILPATNYNTNTNVYEFNQEVNMGIKYQNETQNEKIMNTITVEMFFGEGLGIFPLGKITNSNSVILKNKNNQKYCEVFFNSTIKKNIKQYNILIFLGQYNFFSEGDYYIVLNGTAFSSKNRIVPYNQTSFKTKIISPIEKATENLVVEVWKNSSIFGYLKMEIKEGIKQEKCNIRNIKGQSIGWIRLIYSIDSPKNIITLSESLKKLEEQQIKRKKQQNSLRQKNENAKKQQKQIPSKREQKKQNIIDKKNEKKQQQEEQQESRQNFVQFYLQILENLRTCKNTKCKEIVDKYLNQKLVSKAKFLQFLKIGTENHITQKRLNSFCLQYEKQYPFQFQIFMNSYLKYTFYEKKLRQQIEAIMKEIKKVIIKQQLKRKFKKINLFFGFITVAEFQQVLKTVLSKKLIKKLIKILDSAEKKQIRLEDFYYYLDREDQILEKVIYTPKLYANIILQNVLKITEMSQLLEELFHFKQDQKSLASLSHFQYTILLHQQTLTGFLGLEDQQEQHSKSQLQSQQKSQHQKNIQSQEQEKKEDKSQEHKSQEQQSQLQQDKAKQNSKKIELKFEGIQTNNMFEKQKIKLTYSDIIINKTIYMKYQELPKNLLLTEYENSEIKIYTIQGNIIQGVFLPSTNLKRIKLFLKSKQIGFFHIGLPQASSQLHDSEVVIEINKKQSLKEQPKIIIPPISDQEQQEQNKLIYIQSEYIKIQIVNIIPSGINQIYISQDIEESDKNNNGYIKYPLENTLIFKKSLNTLIKHLNIKVINNKSKNQGTCRINLIEGVYRYPINNKQNGTILNIIEMKLSPHFKQQQKIMKMGKKNINLILYRLDFIQLKTLKNLQAAGLYFLIEYDGHFIKTNPIELKERRSTFIQLSLQIYQADQYCVSLINKKKQVICEFKFQIRFHSELGIHKHYGYLKNSGSRLEIIVYETNYNDDFSLMKRGSEKLQKLFKIFEYKNLKQIQKQLAHEQKSLKKVLRERFKFTFTQINVLEGLIKMDPKLLFQLSSSLQLKFEQNSELDLNEIFEEFSLYDFDNEGFIKQEKAQLVCKLIFGEQVQITLLKQFIPKDHLNQEDRIVNINYQNCELLDYIEFLRYLESYKKDDTFFLKQEHEIKHDDFQEAEKSQEILKKFTEKFNKKLVKISLKKYQNLSYRNMPGTFLFKIGDHTFTDPIPRCLTYKYDEPFPHIVTRYPCALKIFNKQYGMTQLWKFTEIAQVALEEKVKILGGQIQFKIELFQQALEQTTKPKTKLPHELETRRIRKQDQQIEIRKKRDHSPFKQEQDNNSFSQILQKLPKRKFLKDSQDQEEQQNQGCSIENTPANIKKAQIDPFKQKQLEQSNRIRNILTQKIDLSKYNFSESDDDDQL